MPSEISPSPVQRIIGSIRVGGGLLVLASVLTQIVDQATHDAFVPEEYFSYFTIQSSLMNVVTLIAAGLFALRHHHETRLLTTVRLAIFSYAIVTGSVYNLLLRGIPRTGFQGVGWPNDVLHVIIPVYIALDFVVSPGRQRLRWSALWPVIAYPLVWVGFTLIRGATTGWYPYPFLRPDGPAGWGGVITYVAGIAVFIIFLAVVGVLASRIGRTRPVAGSTTPAVE